MVYIGCYVILQHHPSPPSQTIITEGIATGFAIADFSQNASKQSSIFAAISANNLLPVALALRKHYANIPIIIAGDNDDPQNESKNIGKLLAEKAALEVQGKVTLPPTNHKANWDDYRREVGASQAQSDFENSQYVPSFSHNNTINHIYQHRSLFNHSIQHYCQSAMAQMVTIYSKITSLKVTSLAMLSLVFMALAVLINNSWRSIGLVVLQQGQIGLKKE